MSKTDYFVIVYQLLHYYYSKMKKSEQIDQKDISADRLGIGNPYLLDIYYNLFDDGCLTYGEVIMDDENGAYIKNIRITTKGIEYLQDNTKMKQAYKFLKEVKSWIPGM